MPKKNEGHENFPKNEVVIKFDKEVDTGPMDYAAMGIEEANTIHNERIRRQRAAAGYKTAARMAGGY